MLGQIQPFVDIIMAGTQAERGFQGKHQQGRSPCRPQHDAGHPDQLRLELAPHRAIGAIADTAQRRMCQKGHQQCAQIFINAKLQRELAHYVKTLGITDRQCPLFTSQKGSSFSANTMCQLFLDIYKQCGLTGASSHSGRRTLITNLASRGVSVRVLAEIAGHSSISTTQRYIDVNDEQMRAAVELL